mmetsp:Transcript_26860/g.83095  ORF Transcript_26860/g.83095 Transcript_26860/m.83095 type:complete len:505 (-) Transcript_26860:468-1982(-)
MLTPRTMKTTIVGEPFGFDHSTAMSTAIGTRYAMMPETVHHARTGVHTLAFSASTSSSLSVLASLSSSLVAIGTGAAALDLRRFRAVSISRLSRSFASALRWRRRLRLRLRQQWRMATASRWPRPMTRMTTPMTFVDDTASAIRMNVATNRNVAMPPSTLKRVFAMVRRCRRNSPSASLSVSSRCRLRCSFCSSVSCAGGGIAPEKDSAIDALMSCPASLACPSLATSASSAASPSLSSSYCVWKLSVSPFMSPLKSEYVLMISRRSSSSSSSSPSDGPGSAAGGGAELGAGAGSFAAGLGGSSRFRLPASMSAMDLPGDAAPFVSGVIGVLGPTGIGMGAGALAGLAGLGCFFAAGSAGAFLAAGFGAALAAALGAALGATFAAAFFPAAFAGAVFGDALGEAFGETFGEALGEALGLEAFAGALGLAAFFAGDAALAGDAADFAAAVAMASMAADETAALVDLPAVALAAFLPAPALLTSTRWALSTSAGTAASCLRKPSNL